MGGGVRIIFLLFLLLLRLLVLVLQRVGADCARDAADKCAEHAAADLVCGWVLVHALIGWNVREEVKGLGN